MDAANIINISFIALFLMTISIKLILLLINISYMKKRYNFVPSEFRSFITLDEHKKAQEYTILKNKFSTITIVFNSIVLIFWLKYSGLEMLNNFLVSFKFSDETTGVLVLLSFGLIGSLLSLPIALVNTFYIEEKFGFNKTTLKAFFKDLLKQLFISLLIGVPFLYVFIFLINTFDQRWWLYAWAFIMTFQFFILWAYPKFIAPLFNKFTPLDDPELLARVEELLQSCELKFKDFYTMNASIRSSHGNAYFTGFGKNKRIVFFDTLLKTLLPQEVIAVLAHELGHMKKKHILKMMIFSTFSLLAGLYIIHLVYRMPQLQSIFGITDPKNYMAVLIFTLITPYYTFLYTPISSFLSRKNEFEADEFAATYAESKDLISALLKMYKDNSSSLTPHPVFSKFYYSHPPAKERIEFLKSR